MYARGYRVGALLRREDAEPLHHRGRGHDITYTAWPSKSVKGTTRSREVHGGGKSGMDAHSNATKKGTRRKIHCARERGNDPGGRGAGCT